MSTKPVKTQTAARRLPPLPDPPPRGFLPFRYFVLPGVLGTLAIHLKAYPFDPSSATLVSGYGYIRRSRPDHADRLNPNLVVAFDVDCESIISTNGYVIEEVGKPPDLVLEVASPDNGRREYIWQRQMYAELGVPEYWRFDHTGGDYHDAPLACDLLTDGGYQPVTLTTEPDGTVWGYSEVLGLSVCWIEGRLRFWDRAQQHYLRTQQESEARVRELEEELRRRDNP